MEYVSVSKEQVYAHSLRLFRAISEWKNSGAIEFGNLTHDVLAITYFLVPSDSGPLLLGDDDQVIRDTTANLIAAAQLVNPDGPPLAAESSGAPRGVAIQLALKLILAWLKEQGIEDLVAWIIKNIK